MNNRRKYFLVLLQIALWMAFIALPYFMVPRQSEQILMEEFLKKHLPLPDQAQNIFLGSLGFNFVLIIFFYIHHYILFDKLALRKKIGAYVSTILVIFCIAFAASYFFKKCFFGDMPTIFKPISFREFVRTATWFLLVLLASMGLKLLNQWRQAEERAKEIENEQLRTELAFLHAQINPHFLFNSLNTVYSLALKKSDTAPQAVLKLSHLLRYVVDMANKELVPLEEEINYLNNFIELQKLRSTSSLKVDFKLEGDMRSTQIAPLLLLPFVENAFKYGSSSHEESPIDIAIIREKNQLVFTTKNKNFEKTEKHSTGIGINNVQRRLKLLYPNKHELVIDDSNGYYSVKLTLLFA